MYDESDDGPVRPKSQFAKLVCPSCRQADHDAIYRKGADSETRIRARGDFVWTDDNFLCVNRRLHQLLVLNRISGFRSKQIGKSEWFLLNITCRVEHDQSVYQIGEDLDGKRYCAKCRRPTGLFGLHDFESQIQKPTRELAFFTTRPPRLDGAEVFVTEGVVELLMESKIKGGMLARMLNADEEAIYEASVKAGKERWPPQSRIRL